MEHAPEQRLHRCFYALRFEEPTIAYLSETIAALRRHGADVGWVRDANLHLTLRFLGEITDVQLERALTVPDAASVGAFALAAEGLGAFPGLRNAKVIWAGVSSPTLEERSRLEELQSRTERWAREIGLPPENRRYRAHVTLGRVRRPGENLRELIDDVTTRDCSSPPSRITSVVLLRSTLGSGGSVYEELGAWKLAVE
jgi:RNA 2',3'-cyclic 3'-phosphodiesterase